MGGKVTAAYVRENSHSAYWLGIGFAVLLAILNALCGPNTRPLGPRTPAWGLWRCPLTIYARLGPTASPGWWTGFITQMTVLPEAQASKMDPRPPPGRCLPGQPPPDGLPERLAGQFELWFSPGRLRRRR